MNQFRYVANIAAATWVTLCGCGMLLAPELMDARKVAISLLCVAPWMIFIAVYTVIRET